MDSDNEVWVLDCPECGCDVDNVPPHEPNEDFPWPHWYDGENGVCDECGVSLVVSVDGDGRAYLGVGW